MLAKGVIRDVVKWENARKYFFDRLQRRLTTDDLGVECNANRSVVEERLLSLALQNGVEWDDDAAVTKWLCDDAEMVKSEVSSIEHDAKIDNAIQTLGKLDEKALQHVLEKFSQAGTN
jgi:acetyl-CoA carboxylase/biotin carboxylase 1